MPAARREVSPCRILLIDNNEFMKTNQMIKAIEKESVRPIENKSLLKRYILDSMMGKKSITFFNWECPPRKLSFDFNGKMIMDYDVDYNRIFRNDKVDMFSEIPRVIAESRRENKQLAFLAKMGIKLRFVKIIADTNACYLTPESVNSPRKKAAAEKKFTDFKKRITEVVNKDYQAPTGVYFFSELMEPFKDEYEKCFNEINNLSSSDIMSLVSPTIWKEELDRLKDHVGFPREQRKELESFARRVLASYGAEGIVFSLLADTKRFSNCVWLNNEEAEDSAIAITNCLRVKNNKEKMPMIFLK